MEDMFLRNMSVMEDIFGGKCVFLVVLLGFLHPLRWK